MKRTSLAALVLLAACAPATTPGVPSSPGAAPASAMAAGVNPVGRFEFTTAADGETHAVTMQVTSQPGGYGGHVRSPAGEFPITGVTVAGQQMVVTAETLGGPLTITMNFTGTTFTGGWTQNSDSGEIRGQRTP